jgi:hypothetical protein
VLAACGRPEAVEPTSRAALPPHRELALDTTPKHARRLVPPEAFLRAYLSWFGGLAPVEVQKQARAHNLFEQWNDYLGAIGLPDYQLDVPRLAQSNVVMAATRGRLSEALCFRAAEHDFRRVRTADERVVFVFDAKPSPSFTEFADRFDTLHRLFLGYPVDLGPRDRLGRFYSLYQQIVANHVDGGRALSPDETAWAAVCTVLVQDPEAELY